MININKKALIITSRNLNKKGTGEFYRIVSFIKSLQQLGYEVIIFESLDFYIFFEIIYSGIPLKVFFKSF